MDLRFDRLILFLPQKKIAGVLIAYLVDQCWIIFSLWNVQFGMTAVNYIMILVIVVLIELRKLCVRNQRLLRYLRRRIVHFFMPNLVGTSFFVLISMIGYQSSKSFKTPRILSRHEILGYSIWLCNIIHWYIKILLLSLLLGDYFMSKTRVYDRRCGLNLISGYIVVQSICGLLLLPSLFVGMWVFSIRSLFTKGFSEENCLMVIIPLVFLGYFLLKRRSFRVAEMEPDPSEILDDRGVEINFVE